MSLRLCTQNRFVASLQLSLAHFRPSTLAASSSSLVQTRILAPQHPHRTRFPVRHLSSVRVHCMAPEKRKMVKIGTHSGSFHCDEALGCFLLKQLPEYKDADIVRSRDPEVWKDCDILIDVGGVYDPASHRYDHHQREFQDVFGHGFNTRLSSAGLVYKHFGRRIVTNFIGAKDEQDPKVTAVYLAVYKNFMEEIDAIDNGVMQYDSDKPARYLVTTTLSGRVGSLNPRWNEDSSDEVLFRQFMKAVAVTGEVFMDKLDYYAKSWLPAREVVEEMFAQRLSLHASGKICKLPRFAPWKDHLYELEKEHGIEGQILYVLYEDDREKKWRIQAVAESEGSFKSRKALPAPWRGLRDQKLSDECGVPGGVFVHASGFIGGNDTLEGCLAMAVKAAEFQE